MVRTERDGEMNEGRGGGTSFLTIHQNEALARHFIGGDGAQLLSGHAFTFRLEKEDTLRRGRERERRGMWKISTSLVMRMLML